MTFNIAGFLLMCAVTGFRFANCGWRKAYPKLDKFNETMLERPLCKVSLPLKS